MSLVPLITHRDPTTALYAALGSGGGGGGGGGDVTFSTITLTGTNPISATLTSSPNDGFEVRNGGGGGNVITITTIDENNVAQAEMGIRTLSTIGGNTSNIGRFEMQADGLPTDSARLTYTLDRAVSGNASTIGTIEFTVGTAPLKSQISIKTEDNSELAIGNGQVTYTPPGAQLVAGKAAVAGGGNIYVPAAGTNQPVAAFSTISGHAYELYIPNLRVQNEPAGAPAAGAWAGLVLDTTPTATYLDTFDMASVSTIENDLQAAPAYSFVATATGHSLVANGFPTNTLSTAITIAPAFVYLRDLGALASLPTVG